MVRSVIGVIVGYIVMFICLFVAFTTAYLALGVDGAFRPGSYEVSTVWLCLTVAICLVAAIIGGLVCAVIANGGKAALVLAVIVLAVGILIAVIKPKKPTDDASMVRAGNVPNIEAMQKARPPVWMNFLTPVVGAVGVLIGGKLKRRA